MRWLLRLYPRQWRERYEEEMLAVLEEHQVSPATFIDLLMGALDANLHYDGCLEGVMYMVHRLRSGMVMIFCAFMLFEVGWGMLQRLNDPMTFFQAANRAHPVFGILHTAILIVGCLALVALLVGGLPIFFISVKRAVKNRKRDALAPFWVALSCLLLFILETAILADWHRIAFAKHHLVGFFLSYLIVVGIEFIVGTISVALTISRTEFQLRELKLLLIPEIVILFGMDVSVVLSTVLIILITVYAPQLFTTQDVGSPMFITGIIFMALGTIFAWMGHRRGTIKGFDPFTHT
ncbi:hypothetical protein [Alicyclobacillus acidiphilus]|uniref:hypothetical protein n=1 Tax=Alicyclobacillus acidiphilus TaxID=182455 RepID=UPI00082BB205|nr:hypothetical protein [Alicyclobacillus acidiphilus]